MSLTILFLEPSTTEHRDDGVIKVDLDDDSRHWPKETETFATSECTRKMFELGQSLFGVRLPLSLTKCHQLSP